MAITDAVTGPQARVAAALSALGAIPSGTPSEIPPVGQSGGTPRPAVRGTRDQYGNYLYPRGNYGTYEPIPGKGNYYVVPTGEANTGQVADPNGLPQRYLGGYMRMPSGLGPQGQAQGAADHAAQMGWITPEAAAALKAQAWQQMLENYATLDPLEQQMVDALRPYNGNMEAFRAADPFGFMVMSHRGDNQWMTGEGMYQGEYVDPASYQNQETWGGPEGSWGPWGGPMVKMNPFGGGRRL